MKLSLEQKVNEGVRTQEVPLCLLCWTDGAELYVSLRDRLFSAPGTWSLMRCPRCGLVWLNPQPVLDDVRKLYRAYFTHDVSHNPTPNLRALRRLIRDSVLASCLGYVELSKHLAERMLGRVLSWLSPIREVVELSVSTLSGVDRGNLLDVGCGSGVFLTKMRGLGWHVVGVEPDAEAVKVAREHFGLDVLEATLEQANLPDNTFDAVTMKHVIEHVPDPVGTLKECRRVLKSDGRLVVVTPNAESLGAHLFKRAWVAWDPPRHFQILSPRTLRYCAEQAGLQIVDLYTTARSAHWIWAASCLIRRNAAVPGGARQKQSLCLWLTGLAFQFVEYGLGRDAGEELVLIATK